MGAFAGTESPEKEREYAAERLDGVITKIKNAMQHALAKSSGR